MSGYEIIVYLLLILIFIMGFKVVTTSNVIHAAISLVLTLASTAGLFLMLSAEFVALVIILVYIGALRGCTHNDLKIYHFYNHI